MPRPHPTDPRRLRIRPALLRPPRIREEITNRAEIIAWADGPDSYDHWRDGGTGRFDAGLYFRAHSAAFLRSHPHCDVRIITEYGEDVTTDDD